MTNKAITVSDVAKLAGVSAMTVNRAFNKTGPVAAKTYEKIMAAAKELNYQPNILASCLREGKTKTIGLAFSLSYLSTTGELVRHLSTSIQQKGYFASLVDHMSDLKLLKELLSELRRRRTDCVVLSYKSFFEEDEELLELLKRFPAVVIISPNKIFSNFDTVIHSTETVINEVVSSYKTNGKHNPAIITCPEVNPVKTNEFKQALKNNGYDLQNAIIPIVSNLQDNDNNINQLVENIIIKNYDALFCTSDVLAANVMKQLIQRGIYIPETIAITGFNNNPIANFLPVSLASIDHNNIELSKQITDMIFSRLENPELPIRNKLVNMKLIHRPSQGI